MSEEKARYGSEEWALANNVETIGVYRPHVRVIVKYRHAVIEFSDVSPVNVRKFFSPDVGGGLMDSYYLEISKGDYENLCSMLGVSSEMGFE